MRRWSTFGLVCLTLLLMPQRALAQPPTLEAYQQQIRAAYAAAQRSNRIDLDDVAGQLAKVTSVRLPDNTEVPVNNRWLETALVQEPPDYELIEGRLGALLEALNQPRTAPPADALAKLQGVFEVPPFKDREAPAGLRRAWNNFWRSIGDAIARFFEWLFRTSQPSNPLPNLPTPAPATGASTISPLGALLLVLGVLLVLGLVWYAIRGVRGSIVRDAKARKAADDDNLTAAEALNRAQSEAQEGDYRSAVRSLYLSSLLWLHEQRLLRYDRSLTNREYLQQLHGKPTQTRLAPIVDTFDRVWYGKRPVTPDEFAAYEQAINKLRDTEERPQ